MKQFTFLQEGVTGFYPSKNPSGLVLMGIVVKYTHYIHQSTY